MSLKLGVPVNVLVSQVLFKRATIALIGQFKH